MTVKVKIDNKKLGLWIVQIPKINRNGLIRGGASIVSTAMRRAPVDTGYLRSRIKLDTSEVDKEIVWARSSAEYALWPEIGTSKMAAQPYMLPALEQVNWAAILKSSYSELP